MKQRPSEILWWQGASLYQIYPRSFFDTNGDGVGDLAGIHQKLDYIESLNVDGIWISPFYKSPMVDFGYDVSDYRDVDPLFGKIEDLKAFYFHNFLKEQPDLNLHNPKVREELLAIAKFWLDFGVDGFRLDACNCYFHDRSLKDNPKGFGVEVKVQDEENPYFSMVHLYDKSQPENIEFLKDLRTLTDSYQTSGRDIFLLGEIFCDREEETTRSYTSGGKPLQSAYNFSLLRNDRPAGIVRDAVMTYHSISPMTAWSFSNHDVVRVVSRWGDTLSLENRAKAYNTILSGLPGLVIFYQGEELGLTETRLAKEHHHDPFGSNIDSPYPGRDGCRTPIPWKHDQKNFGFSEGDPWLPLADEHQHFSVDRQEEAKESVLNHTRRLLQLRNSLQKSNQIFSKGSIHFWEDDGEAIVFALNHNDQSLIFMANFGSKLMRWEGLSEGELFQNVSEGLEFFKHDNHWAVELLPGGYGILKLNN